MTQVDIVLADLARPEHQRAVLDLTDAYARDPMGGGEPLASDVRERLIEGLRAHPTTVILLAYAGGRPIGIANCFVGFSTFAGKPLLNVHDLGVLPEHRGRGVGAALLAAAEQRARELGCCKLSLEVFEKNPARRLYERYGFTQHAYAEEAGGALFMTKSL